MHPLGSLLIVASAIAFATLGIFGKWAFELGWNSADLLAWRMAASAVWVWLWLGWNRSWKLSPRQMLAPFLLGFVGYGLQTTLYFAALERLSVSVLVLLLYVFPVFVTLLAWLIDKERPSAKALLAMGLSILGIGLTADFSSGLNMLGSFLAVASAAVYAVYLTFSAKVTRALNPLTGSGYIFLGAALSFTLLALLDGQIRLPQSPQDYWLILGISTIASVIPVVLLFWGLRLVSTSQAAILSTIEPVFAALMGVVLLGERLSPMQLLGGVLVLLAMVILQRR